MAEEFFRRLARALGGAMLLTKSELHRLVPLAVLSQGAETEVRAKLDLLAVLFQQARPPEEKAIEPGEATNGNDDGHEA